MPVNRKKLKCGYGRWFVFLFCLWFVCTAESSAQSSDDAGYSVLVRANTVTAQVKLVLIKKGFNDFDRVEIPGMTNTGAPGEPVLPVRTIKFLIPFGQQVTGVDVGWTSKKKLSGTYVIEPGQNAVPLSYTGPVIPALPDAAIYGSSDPYPGKLYDIVSTQNMHGYSILIINIHPVEYIPATGELFYYDNMNLRVNLQSEQTIEQASLFRGLAADRQKVEQFVDNPSNASSYSLTTNAPLITYKYLVITSDTFKAYAGANNLTTLTTHKVSKNPTLTTAILSMTDIASYSNTRPDGGTDTATRIRNCIIDYYTNYGTEYVLLVGDADGGVGLSGERDAAPIVAVRGLYAAVAGGGVSSDSNIPADMYYACLNGTFDNDADGIYGETNDGVSGGDVDLLAEVYVGRAPVDSTTELANFVRKTIAYENTTDTYLTNVLMAGEKLDEITYGDDYMEEVKNGSAANGYTTVGMSGTGYFSFSTLYDRTFSWTSDDLSARLNSGIHILNHLGHATNTVFSKTFGNVQADTLSNTNYFFCFTQGCYSGSFDDRNTGGTYETQDCVLEHFLVDDHGAFAVVGNSRYGWYNLGGTDGGSQRYHREFWDAVVGEGIVNLGKILQDAKQDQVGVINIAGPNRWCYFEINLLGDPQTPLNASLLSPTDLTATNVSFSTASWVTLRWKNSSRADVGGTEIRYRSDGVYPTNQTDGTLLCKRGGTAGETDMFNHTDITPGATYHYVAFGYDPANNYEGSTGTLNRANVTIMGPGGSGSTGRSDCFVATACYGSGDTEPVRVLRKFRDCYLIRSSDGRQWIAGYYIVGPRLAGVISKKEVLKSLTRQCLQPIVCGARFLTGGAE
jgi:hypothetical protein